VFKTLSNDNLAPPVVTMLSVTISTDNTVVWYDHWEDGFDVDVASKTTPLAAKTEVWGDGNSANGCAPIPGLACTNANDVLKAGTAIVIQNEVPILPRRKTVFVYDGGDRIQSSFPVAVTRASFPKGPGSVMAGAGKKLELRPMSSLTLSPLLRNAINSRSVRCLLVGDDVRSPRR
jgi:hypothetical protein